MRARKVLLRGDREEELQREKPIIAANFGGDLLKEKVVKSSDGQ